MHVNTRRFPGIALSGFLLALTACGNAPSPDPAKADPATPTTESRLGGAVGKAMDKAKSELKTSSITLSDHDEGLPKAEITPDGELVIAGHAVETNPAQQAMLIDYRSQLIDIAESGMDIGVQGADLAAKAMGEAFKGWFTGKSEQEIERSVEAEAGGIKAAAALLCQRLPALLAAQDRLAASLPEFAPYATMDESDIDDCMDDHDDPATEAERARIREEIRNGVRGSIRKAVRSTRTVVRETIHPADPAATPANAAAAEQDQARDEDAPTTR